MTSCSSVREQNTAVTSHYNQQTIDIAAEKPRVRLTPDTIMYADQERSVPPPRASNPYCSQDCELQESPLHRGL